MACNPRGEYHFHTGRAAAKRLGYDSAVVEAMPDTAVESFAGVANPFSFRPVKQGESAVDAGSGAGFDSFIAAHLLGLRGRIVRVDMLPEMLDRVSVDLVN